MGKKRIEKITRLNNDGQRKVTLCKRKKGIIKKMIELSVLCDLKIFMLLQDDANQRTTHFSSHKDFNFVECFNDLNQREFFTNCDYEKVGGVNDELDSNYKMSQNGSVAALSDADDEYRELQDNIKKAKIFSIKRTSLLCSSRIGNLREQMKPLPQLTKQVMTLKTEHTIHDNDHLEGYKLQPSNEKKVEKKVQQICSLTSDPINHQNYPLPKYFTVTKDKQMM